MIRTANKVESEIRQNARGGPGSVTFRHFFKKDEFGAKVRLCAELILPSGAGIGMHQHEGEDEIYIITKGAGILDDGKTKTRVTAGDSVLTGKGELHAITNDGKTDLVITAIIISY